MQSSREQGIRKQALNQRDWLLTEQLPPEAEVETLIDDPITGTRLATISNFVNASEIARLVELIDLAPTWGKQRLSVDQRRERGYRYTYVGADEDEVVAAVEDRMAAVSGLSAHPKESRLMVSEYLSLPPSHPFFPLNNIHIDIDVKPDRVATFIICTYLPHTNLRFVHMHIALMRTQVCILTTTKWLLLRQILATSTLVERRYSLCSAARIRLLPPSWPMNRPTCAKSVRFWTTAAE